MTWLTIFGIYIGYYLVNIFIAKWNAITVANRKRNGNPKQIEHGRYLLLYVALCAPQYWLINWWFVGAVLCLHGSIFPVAYNVFSPGISAFNLSKTSKSKYDQKLVKMGFKDMELPDFIAEFFSLFLFVISLFAN